jgi:two-component system, LuxR family, sensor kinase FixL
MPDKAAAQKLEPHSQAFLQAILETAVDAIVTINTVGLIQSFNPAAVHMFGYQAAEVIGKNVNMLMPNPWRDQHDAYVQRYLKTGEPRIIGTGRQVLGRKKDGSTFPIDLAVSQVIDKEERYFIGIIRDMSQQRFMEQALVTAIENERREIGRDLHDALGQIITGISLVSKALAKKLAGREDALAEQAETIAAMCLDAMTETKRLAYGAFPTELERQGLKTALVQLMDNIRKIHRIETHFYCDRHWHPMPPATELHLYRIAQESVANAVKHGRPNNIWLRIEQQGESALLEVRDDGVGIKQTRESGRISMGLHIMRHRASLIGGEFDIRPGEAGGTEVLCCIRSPIFISRPS